MSETEVKRLVSYRLDSELVEAIAAKASAEKRDKTEIVDTALRLYLGLAVGSKGQPIALTVLTERITEIESRLLALEGEKLGELAA